MAFPGKVNLTDKLASIDQFWSYKIVGDINDFQAKLVKIKGEFIWHHHPEEDELFLVLKGRLRMEFREGEVEVGEGEIIIVPHGVEHRPIADEEVHLMLVERASTLNTGNVISDRTVTQLERI